MGSTFHAFMFPWFAFGHMTPFLHLANKLAEKGNRVTFLLPKKAEKLLEHLNLFPDNIVFHPLIIPRVDGLPLGAETASDIPISLGKFLTQAMELTRDQVEDAILAFKPDLIFFDTAYWVPEMAKEYKVKSVSYHVVSAASVAYTLVPDAKPGIPPLGYPSSKVTFRAQDAYSLLLIPSDSYKRICNRITTGLMNCDVISLRTCQEVEGKFCDFIELQFQKKVLLTGPMLPEQDKSKPLEDRWSNWLNKFEPGSVVYCAMGSQINLEKDQFQELCLGMELTGLPFLVAVNPPKGAKTIQEALPEGFEERVKYITYQYNKKVLLTYQYNKKVLLTGPLLPEADKIEPLEEQWSHFLSGFAPGSVVFCALGSQINLEKDQFQELCLGMELTGLPFLVAVKPPKGAKTIQEALPEGFEERVKGRGVVWGGWVQQPLILSHPSVGCFVSHCGFGSTWESLMSDCQIVLLPYLGEQVLNTRLMTEELEVSVEVSRDKTGGFSKESLSDAVMSVMHKDSEVGKLVRRNHAKLKEILVRPGLLTGYVDKFVKALQD